MIHNTLHTEKALNCDKNNFLKGYDKELKKNPNRFQVKICF